MDNIEKIEKAKTKKLRKIASAVVAACICIALLCIYTLDRDKELHIGWAGGTYPGSEDYCELRSLTESVLEDLGYSETYPAVVIDEVNTDAAMFGNQAYNLLLLPASSMGSCSRVEYVTVVADLSGSQSMRDIGLDDLCIVLINWEGKTDKAELERLTAIGEALQ